MKVLDLFSGIGGFSLGLERAGMETAAFCEIEPYCRKILRKHWPNIPIHEDIKQLDAKQYRGSIDLVCGGYPCQPFSVAGKQAGENDDRHLWPSMLKVIQDCRPRWVIAENVAGHIRLGLDQVLFDLEAEGYTAQSIIIPACAVNAPHRRDRVWIIGYTDEGRQSALSLDDETSILSVMGNTQHNGPLAAPITRKLGENGDRPQEGTQPPQQFKGTGGYANHEAMADAHAYRMQARIPGQEQGQERHTKKPNNRSDRRDGGKIGDHWTTKPGVGRVVDGLPHRVDRIKALGNSVVPQIPEIIGRCIMEIEAQ